MSILQIIVLAIIQGAAELLPVSSSAHVILAEKLMGLDPASPEMTFLLVMLHTGTMFSVLVYFWARWKKWKLDFLKMAVLATGVTGFLGLGLKAFIEKIILGRIMGEPQAEIEHLFKSLPLISLSLLMAGVLILLSSRTEAKAKKNSIVQKNAILIGVVQGICLPFRGFSRSGATISTGMIQGVSRKLSEDFSFLLAVILTPPIIVRELYRLLKATSLNGIGGAESTQFFSIMQLLVPGLIGMVFSFATGLLALKWLSSWLDHGKWKYFGFYCIFASGTVLAFHQFYF